MKSSLSHGFSREFRLATACANWPPSDERVFRVREASRSGVNWQLFTRVIKRHRICALARDGLKHAGVAPASSYAAEITTAADGETRQEMLLSGDALRLQSCFLAAGIPILVLKGVPLALVAFGRLGLRSHRDIDFLVPQDRMLEAATLLEMENYERVEPPSSVTGESLRTWLKLHKDLSFEHRCSGTIVELHSRLFDNRTVFVDKPGHIEPRLVYLTKQHWFRTLPEDICFPYLCRHGAEHAWSRLKWLADIGALLSTGGMSCTERYFQVAEDMGLGRAAAVAMLLSTELFGTPTPAKVYALAVKDWRLRLLVRIALRCMTAGQGALELEEQPLGTTLKNLSHYLMSEDWSYWRQEFQYDLADTSQTPIPGQLTCVAPVLRPLLWAWQRATHHGRGRCTEKGYDHN
jgi:hypothetical protein